MFEHKKRPLLPKSEFAKRMLFSMFLGIATVAVVIVIGILGFHFIQELDWLDAFLESAMYFGSLGATHPIEGWGSKLFASFYAILCPFAVVASVTILVLPLLHRFLHKFHIDTEGLKKK